jgi:transposase
MGRSRGGLTTKIHALVDADGRPIRLMLTPARPATHPRPQRSWKTSRLARR